MEQDASRRRRKVVQNRYTRTLKSHFQFWVKTRTYTHAHTHVHMQICTRVHTHIQTHRYTHAHTRTHTCARSHTRAHTRSAGANVEFQKSLCSDIVASLMQHLLMLMRDLSHLSGELLVYTHILFSMMPIHAHTHTRTHAHTNNASSTPVESELHTLLYDVYLLLVSDSVGL